MIFDEIDNDDLDFEGFRNTLFETCVQVLEKLRTEKFFRNELGKNLLVLFSISDTSEPKENLIQWGKRLNNEETGNRFEDYLNYEYE